MGYTGYEANNTDLATVLADVDDSALIVTASTTAAANAAYTALLTASGICLVEDCYIVGDAGADSTTAALEITDGGYVLINTTDAAVANLAAATDIVRATSTTTPQLVLDTQTIGLDLLGTGATATALAVYVKYRPVTAGATLS